MCQSNDFELTFIIDTIWLWNEQSHLRVHELRPHGLNMECGLQLDEKSLVRTGQVDSSRTAATLKTNIIPSFYFIVLLLRSARISGGFSQSTGMLLAVYYMCKRFHSQAMRRTVPMHSATQVAVSNILLLADFSRSWSRRRSWYQVPSVSVSNAE